MDENTINPLAETSAETTIVKEENIPEHSMEEIKSSFEKPGRILNMKKILIIILGAVVAGGIVFGLFSLLSSSGVSFLSPLGDGGIRLGFEKSVLNPLTGELIPESKAKAWMEVRPLAIMVNNYVDARPQSGLIYADLVYEIVAEGGITRLLPFYLSDIPEKIGPVRSTREYYLVLVMELGDAMLMHIGWSPQALEAIETWPVRSLGRGGGTFWRDNPRNVASEHTAYVNGVDLLATAVEIGWEGTREFVIWAFKDAQGGYESYPAASELFIDFWYEGDYSAIFKYNSEENVYLRSMGYDAEGAPIPHSDQETNEQIKIKNLIVQFVEEIPIPGDDKNRLDYKLIGTGDGLIFIDGKVIEVTWLKEERDSRTMFYDLEGQEMQFNRGKFWISIVPDRNVEQVVYN